jgi:hypothetical protein
LTAATSALAASALGGARTPISQALVEAGLFLSLIAGANWVYEHVAPSAKPMLQVFFFMSGFFIGFLILVRVVTAIIGTMLPKVNRK